MTRTKQGLVGASMIVLLGAMPAWANDDDTPEQDRDPVITVTATRAPVLAQDAPATVTVIDERQIADEIATDIKDLVRFEPGVSVTRQPTRFGAALGTAGRAGNEGFTIRGVGGNRVLIMVDGVRVPDGFTFGAQSVGRGDYVDLGLVKSVEILRGPASALYGSDGLAGAVSFTTSDPRDFLGEGNIGGLLRASYSSSDNEFAETGIIAARAGDWSAMAAYTRRDFNELDNKGTTGGTGSARTEPNPLDGRSDAALGRIVFESGAHRLRLTGEYIDTRIDHDVLTGHSATVLNLDASDTGNRARAAFDWTWNGEGSFEFARVGVYWQKAEDRQFTFEDRTPAVDRTRINTFDNEVIGASAEARFRFDTGTVTHRLVIGGDLSRTHQEGLRDGTVPPAGEVFPTRAFPETDFTLGGLFVADEVTIGPVTLYPALRFDYYELTPENDPLLPSFRGAAQDGSRISPKFGAVAKLTSSLRLFGSYGQGFKAPSPSQVNNFFENPAQGYTSIPNPDLGPETSRSFEGGLRFSNALVEFSITGFHSEYDDFIDQVETTGRTSPTPQAPWIYQWVNLTGAEVNGVEGRVDVRPGSGISATLAVSYADGDAVGPTGTKIPLQSVDPLKAVFGLGYDHADRDFGGRLMMTYVGQKEAAETLGSSCYPSAAVAAGCFTGDPKVVIDVTAYWRLLPGLTLRAGVFNLADQKYWLWSDIRGLAATSTARDAYSQPGRNGSVSLSYRF